MMLLLHITKHTLNVHTAADTRVNSATLAYSSLKHSTHSYFILGSQTHILARGHKLLTFCTATALTLPPSILMHLSIVHCHFYALFYSHAHRHMCAHTHTILLYFHTHTKRNTILYSNPCTSNHTTIIGMKKYGHINTHIMTLKCTVVLTHTHAYTHIVSRCLKISDSDLFLSHK